MSSLIYNFFILVYGKAIYIVSFFNKKAKKWVQGRKDFPDFKFDHQSIWMHCSSLGEFEQGRPVIEALKKEYPNYPIVISFFSPSGFEVRKNYPGAEKIIYLPLDTTQHAKKLIDIINPALVVWVKYEYWFNYLFELKKREIPVLLISGIFRPAQPFFKWYGNVWKKMLSSFHHLFLQNENSVALLAGINLNKNISVSGDTRFDRVIDLAEKKEEVPGIATFINNQETLIAGSTWEDDEAELVHYTRTRNKYKFIIAPHEISESNLKDLKTTFKNSIFYSDLIKQHKDAVDCNVLIIDSIGLLSKLYRYATVTYVGGGFNSSGIHNTLEAAVYGKPVIFGPEYEKFAEAKALIKNGAAFSIDNALALENKLDDLFNDKILLEQASDFAKKYVYSNRGATQKIMNHIIAKRLLIN